MNGRARNLGAKTRAVFKVLYLAPLMAATLTLVACGGGGYSSMPAPPPKTPAAKSSMTVGAITGFGVAAVNVNGKQFQTAGAAISIDGKAGQQGDLHAGDVVQIKGHHDASSNEDVADEIDFRGNVVGPVGAIDTTALTLVVLGQNVVVSAGTSFDDEISPASLAGIHIGDVLEVSGMASADGTIQATRIERKPAGSTFQASGTASATNAAAQTLNINALVVDFSAAMLSNFPSTGPQDGDLVEATGTVLEASGALQATRLELVNVAQEMQPGNVDNAEVEGLITQFVSVTHFDVAGRPVTVTASTEFEGGAAGDLALNVHVEVEGSLDAAGVIEASKIRIAHPADARITAQVDSVDAAAATVRLLGTEVSTDAMTRFEDHGSEQMTTFTLQDVQVGDWLEVRGTSAADGTSVVATRLDRLQPQSEVHLAGPVTAAAPPNLTILATPVATNGATQFSDGLDAGTFFDSLTGKVASVRGSWDGSTLSASAAQLGDSDDGGDD